MKRAERMRKAGMFGRLIRKIGQSELPDAAQTLKLSRIDQPDKQFSLVRIGFEANDVVNGIAVNFL